MSWIALEAVAHLGSRANLSASSRLVLFALAHHQNHTTEACFPGFEAIAETAGVSVRSVSNALAELTEAGLILVRTGEGVPGKGRPTHAYDLTFVAQFKAERARKKHANRADFPANPADFHAAVAGELDSNRDNLTPQPPKGGRKAKEDISPEDRALAQRLWAVASKACRKRSGLDDTARAARAALARGATADELVVAVVAHCTGKRQTEENGRWAKGLHRLIEQDRWREWYPDDAREAAAILAAEAKGAVGDEKIDHGPDDIGTLENPGPRRQRAWLEDWARNPFLWKVHAQGPLPGDPGCRCDPDLIREFGGVPYGEKAA